MTMLVGPLGLLQPLATAELAARAVQLVLPTLQAALLQPYVGDSGFLYIVIMDPAKPPARATFEDAILHEHAVGDRDQWDADYAAFARAKARVSWHTGSDGHKVQSCMPQLLTVGDTTLWGSVALDGIVVGVSGAHPSFDEAFSGMVAMCMRALIKSEWQRTAQK